MALFSRTAKAAKNDTATAVQAGRDLKHLSGDYRVDPDHSEIGFAVRHAMVATVRGRFADFEGNLSLDGADPSRSSAELVIKVASIDTNQEQRDEHLRTSDFFDASTFEHIAFRSTSAERLGDDAYRMTGDLTIKDVTRPVTLDLAFNGHAKDPYGNDRVGFEGVTKVNRADWGLSYNAALEAGGVLIGEQVKLSFDISAVKEA
ncbi:YceI family protein [Streptomyces inhibens]|uniref:YceI family protein n=1 Tax=Streptomyces inhibens TaxID=2293571 RepID=UPI001EE6CA21|nr:YceI family protein [Streptomyces inhibens]UKY53844.1 YceI family protein [Streptomyces inhibens]